MEATTTSLPPTEPNTTAATTATAAQSGTDTNPLPPITSSASPAYATRFNDLVAGAFVHEALTKVLRHEADRPADGVVTKAHVHQSYGARISSKLEGGSVIVEAGDWAAAAIWDPPGAYQAGWAMSAEEAERRPVYVQFMRDIRATKLRHMGQTSWYWHLAMMARNPAHDVGGVVPPRVKGAVRAVVEPYLRRAREEGLPVWIEASSPRARDVYRWMGFELLEEFRAGEGTYTKDGNLAKDGEAAEGVPIWVMIYNRQDKGGMISN